LSSADDERGGQAQAPEDFKLYLLVSLGDQVDDLPDTLPIQMSGRGQSHDDLLA
jgi:hypothetical protein